MRPHLSATSSSRVLMGLQRFSTTAAMAGVESLDVVADRWSWHPRFAPNSFAREYSVPIASIVVSKESLPELERHTASITWLQHEQGGTQIVVRLPEMGNQHGDQVAALHASRAVHTSGRFSSAVLLAPATALEGGRVHLARLHALRRLAEEWELTLGLDFCVHTDARWEAEAAVQIVSSRLSLIRVRSNVHDLRKPYSDVTIRALKAAADERFSGRISMVPVLPIWRSWNAASLTHELLRAREAVTRVVNGLPATTTIPSDAPIRFR